MNNPTQTPQKIAANILRKVESAKKIMIVCSKPIDPDSLGTALACKIWLEQLGKNVTVINSFRLTENMKNFPDVDLISFEQENTDLSTFDLVVTLDSRIWSQLFKNKDIILLHGLDKFVNIDHHSPADIAEDIPETTLRTADSSTAEVLYTYLLADNAQITPRMATYLYIALVGDTGNFKWALGPHTLEFADVLVKAGADLKLAESFLKPSEKELQYSEWAHANIEHYPDLGIELLMLSPEKDAAVAELLQTEYWGDFMNHFVVTFFDDLDLKYNYFITLKPDEDELKLSWRTRNDTPNTVEVMQAAINTGFAAGGHRNAGGGSIKLLNRNIETIKEELFRSIRVELEKIKMD